MPIPKILLADDDSVALREFGMVLRRHGYTVIPVEDGYQAIDQAVRHEPDVMVLDVHMPAGDGFSVHDRVIQHSQLCLTPVIFMTHDLGEETARMVANHGAVALLYKPFDPEQLLDAVREALSEFGCEAA